MGNINFGFEFSILFYFYKISYEEIGNLTYPQYISLKENLFEIKKIENGEANNGYSASDNVVTPDKVGATDLIVQGSYEMLKKSTGRTTFTLAELSYPIETIKKHKKKQETSV